MEPFEPKMKTTSFKEHKMTPVLASAESRSLGGIAIYDLEVSEMGGSKKDRKSREA